MKAKADKLAGWVFHAEEVSAGVYKVSAIDRAGRNVERTGTDPDKLRDACRKDAEEIERQIIDKAK